MRYFLILTIIIISFKLSYGQRRCATQELHEQKMFSNPELYNAQEDYKNKLNKIIQNKKAEAFAANDLYTIPVVVHVIYNNSTTNISDDQILSQIQVLNEDYRRKPGTNGYNTHPLGDDVNIEFCLATVDTNGNPTTGIVRIYNGKSSWDPSEEVSLKALSYWNSDEYLNIWVCKLGGGYLGYAQFPVGSALPGPTGLGPELDGVVIDYRAFGRTGTAGTGGYSLYYLGRTVTHEVGHWLGLVHIWGDGSGCTTDYVNDTPLDAWPNEDGDCKDSSDCDGDMVFEQDFTFNYLDYSPDVCMNMFTTDQKTRMRTVMETAPLRLALLSSQGCCIPRERETIPFTEDFEDGLMQKLFLINPDVASEEWKITSQAGGFGTSLNSIFIENDLSTADQVDFLQTNYINFTEEEPGLEFDLAYAKNATAITDSLVVSYSTNCTDWIPLLSLSGNALATTSRITDNFTPSASEWKKIRIDLENLNFQVAGRIRFENYSKNINNLYIDNINIHKNSKSLIVKTYPNPTSDIINVEVILEDVDNVKYELFDILGQKVFEETDYEKTSYTKSINLSGLASGLYILRVKDKKQSVSKKIVLSY